MSAKEEITEDSKCIIETTDGPVCGYIDKRDEGTYYQFKSIPYALPPIGRLRFLPPSPIKPWTELLDCTKDAPLPTSIIFDNIVGSEDCLYIEVSTPNIKPVKPLPIMFWIGSFNFVYYLDPICDPTPINNEEVVFVRCGFRLGPFGFLSINDITAPGNNGLKDIVMALKWVQRNIKYFGGDPNNVTIFGSSAGGAIVHFMMLSPMATGLFHKAIMQSACALNEWSLSKNPSQRTMELARELGLTTTEIVEVVEELRKLSTSTIMDAYYSLTRQLFDAGGEDFFNGMFKPCIENEFEGQPTFLNKSPILIIKSGNYNKVPFIIGSNNIEASIMQYIKHDFYEDFEKYNENVTHLVPKSLVMSGCSSKKIGQQLLNFYFDSEVPLKKETRTQFLQLISDYYFLFYVNKTVRLHSQVAPECPIYYYIITYAGEWSVPKDLIFFNSIGHCAEIPFIFRIKAPTSPISPYCKGSRDSIATRNRIVKMWTNFAKYGNPTPDDDDPLLQISWDPVVKEDKLNYLSIGSELTKGRNPFHDRMVFWEQLYNEHIFLKAIVYLNNIGVTL